MFDCALSARYSFKADVWKKTMTTNKAGQLVATWTKDKTIDCFAETIIDGGIRVAGTTERFTDVYYNIDWIKLTSKVPLRRSDRVTNIRPANSNTAAWVEEELTGTPPTWFNANGSAPITDPFGRVVEYKTLLERAEVQGSGN